MNARFIALIFFSTLSITASDSIIIDQNHAKHATEWIFNLTKSLQPQDIQIASNILYLLYANSLIDIKIRQFIIPITRLNQSVRSNIINYKDTTKELTTLKTLLERLSYVIGARTIYNQKLTTCLNYYNAHQSTTLTQSILELQTYGQNSLNKAAELNSQKLGEFLKVSSETLGLGAQSLQDISKIHDTIARGLLPEELKNTESLAHLAALITIDELLKNNYVATQNTEHVLNTLDASTESALHIILSATEIYKHHYEALYTYISSDDFDQSYAYTLFGMNDLLPDEYKSLLPHPDDVFEHVLQTIKLYTQIELIQ
jgi:hypothetical protein